MSESNLWPIKLNNYFTEFMINIQRLGMITINYQTLRNAFLLMINGIKMCLQTYFQKY